MKVTAHHLVNILFIASAMIGLFSGWKLNLHESFQYFKLVNLIGLIYDVVAVLLLSYVILTKGDVQHYIAHKLSMFVIIFSAMFPVSLVGGAMATLLWGAQMNSDILIVVYIYVAVSIVPTWYLFGSPVFEPVGNVGYSPENRIKILGALLLVMGFVFQLVAAFGDLVSGA